MSHRISRRDEKKTDAIWDAAILNLAIGPDGAYNGKLFETYAPELQRVRDHAWKFPNRVVTILECEGRQYLSHGYHSVNRLGYFLFSYDLAPFEDVRFT